MRKQEQFRLFDLTPYGRIVNSLCYIWTRVYTVKPVFSDHIKQDIFLIFRQVVAYCYMKVVQEAHS